VATADVEEEQDELEDEFVIRSLTQALTIFTGAVFLPITPIFLAQSPLY
jgi:hypothetical protein